MAKHLHRTAVFTLHNPTRHIRAVLDEALQNYTRAYSAILDFFSGYTVEEFHAMATYTKPDGEQDTSARTLETSLFRRGKIPELAELLEPLEARLRASMKSDIAASLLSYVELSVGGEQKPSYPKPLEEEDIDALHNDALEGLRTIADDLSEETQLRDQVLHTRQPGLRPLLFGNSMPDQGFRIFYNPETHRFYARLYVIGASSRHKKPLTMAGQYVDIRNPEDTYMRHEDAKNRDDVKDFGTGTRSIFVPLELGRWHETQLRFTEHAFLPQRGTGAKPAWPVSAKLVKSGEDYQLHVAFQFPQNERIKPKTYLGVDRSLSYLASGAVMSLDGREVLETFDISATELHRLIGSIEKVTSIKQQKGRVTKGDRRRARIADHHIHLCANKIVELALEHQSQVVLEDLSFVQPRKRPEAGKRGRAFNRILNRRQYQKLQEILETKLKLAGLPHLRKVGTSMTSTTCSRCGCVSKDNFDAEDRSLFHCSECGYEANVYQQAGVNIVRKLSFLALRLKEKQREIPETKRTSWEQFARTFH